MEHQSSNSVSGHAGRLQGIGTDRRGHSIGFQFVERKARWRILENQTMGHIMMDETTITRLHTQKNRSAAIKKREDRESLKFFYEQIRLEKIKQHKLKKIIKIIVISFTMLITVMVTNLQTLSTWEAKTIQWFLKYPGSFENPFNLQQ